MKETKALENIKQPSVVQRIIKPSTIEKIGANTTFAAGVMVVAALLAVMVANSDLYEMLHEFFETPLGLSIGAFSARMTLESFINDFLMAIFFLLVGIELKYEMVVGQLRRPRQAALPMLAAVGGVCVPACIYLIFNAHGLAHGWAIPIATDIAFALGVMSLLGSRVANETKVFFQTLAIADDLLAIVVLALFYGQTLDVFWCFASLLSCFCLFCVYRAHVFSAKPYLLIGLVLWVCMYNSGIHPTLAGVILAFFLPARSDIRLKHLHSWLSSETTSLDDHLDMGKHILGQHDAITRAQRIETILHHVTPPLERVESHISFFVNFFVLPVFAFTNAQVRLVGIDFSTLALDPVVQGVFLGATLGKPIGIILVVFVLVRIGFARLPKHVDWIQIIGLGIMGALGFTMSILISGLAFSAHQEVLAAKFAVLTGSVSAGIFGILFILIAQSVQAKANGIHPNDPHARLGIKKSASVTPHSQPHNPNHEQ